MIRVALASLEQTADALRQMPGSADTSIAWEEFRNKLRAFTLFEYSDSVLGLNGRECSLSELVERTTRLDPYDGVWAAEGAGYYYAEAAFAGGDSPRTLLRGSTVTLAGPAKPIALHAGM